MTWVVYMVDKTELTSAFADGELNHKEVGDLLADIYTDNELRERWQRYHLIGEALRKNLPPSLPTDLASRVSKALENEPTIFSPEPTFKHPPANAPTSARGYKTGLAVAASVAIAGFVSFFTLSDQTKSVPQQVAVIEQVSAPVAVSAPAITTTSHVVMANAKQPLVVDRIESGSLKLKSYILDHEYSTSSAVRRGLPPAVRVVTFSNDR
jgi:sigma-E factor negative regulatory protein RseA